VDLIELAALRTGGRQPHCAVIFPWGTAAGAHRWQYEPVRERLFSAGERLGWEFRDRLQHWRHFAEPPPGSVVPDPDLGRRLGRANARLRSALVWAAATFGVTAMVSLVALAQLRYTRLSWSGVVLLAAMGTALLVAAAWLVLWRPARSLREQRAAQQTYDAVAARAQERHGAALTGWQARGQVHNAAEWQRIDGVPEWGAVRAPPATTRIDVFGGSLRSWEGFLTTFGASMVAESPPVRVLDLSEGLVAEELCRLTEGMGMTVSAQVLPRQLAASDLLVGVDGRQLTELLVESIHGDRPDSDRAGRAMDARILGALCDALAPGLSLARLHEALLVLMGEPAEGGRLDQGERERIAGGLFSADYARQAHDRLRSLEAHLHPLRELGSAEVGRFPRDARLQCLALGEEGAGELLVDLAGRWATREGARVLIVAGADRLSRRRLERLADQCERRRMRLVYLFRHLRDDAAQVLGGGGAVIFMRLGHQDEAERASRFVGHGHRFVLSRITRGFGGTETQRRDASVGETRSRSQTIGQFGVTTSRSRTWGVTRSFAEETNWHYAETEQRVYEFLVEPTTLQNLPDYALLVVQPGHGAPVLRVADCNPDIVSLPRVSTDPLPEHVDLPELGPPTLPSPHPPTQVGEGGRG
jgi:hypothetical protein